MKKFIAHIRSLWSTCIVKRCDYSSYSINRLIVFFGSGASYKTGLPNVKTITSRVLHGAFRYNDLFFEPCPPAECDEVVKRIQKFLRLVYNEITKPDFGLEKNPNYEDLYHLYDMALESDFATQSWAKTIRSRWQEVSSDESVYGVPHDVKDYINCVVWHSLMRGEREIQGFDLLKNVIDESEAVDLVTLNHDTLIEDWLEELGLQRGRGYATGFEPDGVHRPGRLLNTDAEIRLIKLHGSINWCQDDAIVINRNPNGVPTILTGYHKELVYQNGIFLDMQDAFRDALRKSNRIIMCGYGGGDNGINLQIGSWLDCDEANRLILFHDSKEAGKNSLTTHHRLNKQQVDVIDKWFSDANWGDLESRLGKGPA